MKQAAAAISIPDRLAALSEMVRLRICRVLEREELSVGEVAQILQMPQSTVSRHLKVLGDAGWLVRRAEGPATMYRFLLDDLPPEARALWLAVRQNLADTPDLAEDARRLESVLAERMADGHGFFGRVAGEWDDLRNGLFGHNFTARALLGVFSPDWTFIDAGCGTGNASELLAPYVHRVVAVDSSATMLKAARKRLAHFSNVDFIRADLDALPLPDACADAAACVLVMHHVDTPERACAELHRALKPGGLCLIVDMLEHDRSEYRRSMGHKHLGFSPERAASMLSDAGFQRVRVVPLPGEPAARGPSLYVATARASDERRHFPDRPR